MNSGDDVKLTKTGRISKAKKGLKDVHVCECGKVSEHVPFVIGLDATQGLHLGRLGGQEDGMDV